MVLFLMMLWNLVPLWSPSEHRIPEKIDSTRVLTLSPAQRELILYGSKASLTKGDLALTSGERLIWKGPGMLAWAVSLNEQDAGAYRVIFNVSLPDAGDGTRYGLESASNSISGRLKATRGYFGTPYLDYELQAAEQTIELPAGTSTITFTLPEPKIDPALHFRSIILQPLKDLEGIRRDEARAEGARADMAWLRKAGYGVMFHWTSQSQPKTGRKKSYAEAVRDFDVKAFADMATATGAGYVIFTANHADPHFPAPLPAWETVHPGWTTRRDLIAEIADALAARDIRLILYFATHTLANYPKASPEEFIDINRTLMTEVGERYGNRVAGYWLDGWYQCYEKYPDVSFEDFYFLTKIGNPNRIVALNSWIYPKLTPWQDYWAGEVASPVAEPEAPVFRYGPALGLPYHALLVMENEWVHGKADSPITAPRFTAETLADYIRNSNRRGGVVTINLMIYQDGSISDASLDVMKEIRRLIPRS